MELAVRTAASPAAIWVIVIVMTIMTAILVSAASVADSWQVRTNRRQRGLARLGASVGDLIKHDGALPPDQTSSGAPRAATGAPGAAWPPTRAGSSAEPGPGDERGSRAPVPGQRPATAATGTPATELAETMTEAEAPTRPDLPPVPGKPAMPPPRSGEDDRAERTRTGRPPTDGETGGR